MGYGTTRSLERVAAAMGALEAAPIVFEAAQDIPQGGVLLALPALLAVGLLRHSAEQYELPKGFYGLSSVFVLLGLMALARIDSLEQLRYEAAGEWGNLLGLDRAPEVRTLRAKVKLLCGERGRAARRNAILAQEWIGQHAIEQGHFGRHDTILAPARINVRPAPWLAGAAIWLAMALSPVRTSGGAGR